MLKATWKGRRIHISVIESSFQRDEAHFFEAQYFVELAEEGEIAIARPRGVPLLAWEDFEGNEPDPDNCAYTST